MPKESKEQQVLELFFNEPTKHWHFQEIAKKINLAENKVSKWLKKFTREGLIKRFKPQKKMPYYVAEYNSHHYTNTKLLFGLQKFQEAGLLDHLSALENAKTVILFGSFSRGDWYSQSDIDLFIYGIDEQQPLQLGQFYFKLHREVQVFSGKKKEDLKKIGGPLLRNIIKGIRIKGDIPKEVWKYALT